MRILIRRIMRTSLTRTPNKRAAYRPPCCTSRICLLNCLQNE